MKKLTLLEWKAICAEFRQYGYDPYDSESGLEWGWKQVNGGGW